MRFQFCVPWGLRAGFITLLVFGFASGAAATPAGGHESPGNAFGKNAKLIEALTVVDTSHQSFPAQFKQFDSCLFGGPGCAARNGNSNGHHGNGGLAGIPGGGPNFHSLTAKLNNDGPSRPVPEPSAALLFGIGVLIVADRARRRAA